MMKKIGTVAGASIAAFAVGATVAGGIAIASADDNSSTQDSATTGQAGPMGMRGPGEIVTGENAQKAIDAALTAVQGTADHAHKTPDGGYVVMVTTADGKRIVVTLDANFVVTGQQEMTGRGPGHGTPATAEETQKATEAAVAEVPGATVLQVFKRDEGGFAVLIRTDAGKKQVVLLGSSYAVESVENAPKRGHGRHGHMGRDVTGPAFKKAEAAVLAKYEGATVLDVHKVGKKFVAATKKQDGTVVFVKLNSSFEVTGTAKMPFGRGPGPMPMMPSAGSASNAA